MQLSATPIQLAGVPLANALAAGAEPPTPTDTAGLPGRAAPDAQGSAGWKLWNEKTATRPIVDAIDGAKQVVNVEFFGFSDGGKGAHVVDALERAAQRGVEVNVVTDAVSLAALPVGSWWKMRNRIEDAGGTVKSNFRLPIVRDHDDTPGLKHVNHRKVITIDGTTAFTGGINYIKLEDDFHDSMVQLSGVTAARLAADQLDRWSRVGGAVSDRHRTSVEQGLAGASLIPATEQEMRVITNAPEQGKFELSDAYRDLIRGARTRLWISSPGWSDQELMSELNEAAKRGVDVRVVAAGKPPLGIPIINWVGDSHLRELVSHGGTAIAIPEVLHRKALIADDEVVFSSFNMTGRSKTHDHEVGVRTKDPEFVAAITKVLQSDMDRGTKVEDKADGIGDRIGDLIAQKIKISY